MRELIKDLARRATVILSTHILQEVQAICDRVIIINRAMTMWSEERRAGTFEFLMTTPVQPLHLVLGKFLACIALIAIALALTLPLPLTVSLARHSTSAALL
jgi:ABC-type transport system involved in multi-copper enzyme maturation permease subunit